MTTLELLHPDGSTYSLSDGAPFALIDEEMGMSDVRRLTDRGPLQHGDSDLDFRLEPTMYPLGLLMLATSISEHYTNRALALRLFRPSKTPLKLRWTLDNGDVRQLDAHVHGRIVFSGRERRGFTQRFVVPLRAADPTFYDPEQRSQSFGITAGGSGWTIPWAVPWGIGAATLDHTVTITYPGTWETFPIITVQGPITDCVITNEASGDVLDLTGITIDPGETYTIDLRQGRKVMTDQSGTRVALADGSDLATWSLLPDPEALDGLNSINVTGTSVTTETQIYIRYYHRYIGH